MSPGDTFLSGIIANISVSVGGISVSLTVSIFTVARIYGYTQPPCARQLAMDQSPWPGPRP